MVRIGDGNSYGYPEVVQSDKEINLKIESPFCQRNQPSLPPQEVDAQIDGERALPQMLEELDARPSQIPSVPVQVRRLER